MESYLVVLTLCSDLKVILDSQLSCDWILPKAEIEFTRLKGVKIHKYAQTWIIYRFMKTDFTFANYAFFCFSFQLI